MRVFIVVASLAGILLWARPASADTIAHAGLNVRAGNGTHPFRIIAGLDTGDIDLSLTVDPMVISDGQLDTDLISTVKLTDAGWGALLGWRTTMIGILGGREFQEKLVIGVGAPLPLLGDGIRMRWALEATAVIVKHGGDLPTDWISFKEGRDFVDLINFGMFITFEGASGH